jgi:lysozyme family protein
MWYRYSLDNYDDSVNEEELEAVIPEPDPADPSKITKPKPVKPLAKPVATKTVLPRGKFNEALNIVLDAEGGYSNVKGDPGGQTNRGVTHRTYNRYRSKKNLPTTNVKNISDKEVNEIYRNEYWNLIKGNALPKNIATSLLSLALTDGPQDSIAFVQNILITDPYFRKVLAKANLLKDLKIDKLMGKNTMTAIWYLAKRIGEQKLTIKIQEAQKAHYQSKKNKKFIPGWLNRVDKVTNHMFGS